MKIEYEISTCTVGVFIVLMINSIITLDKAVTDKTHELHRAENPFALSKSTTVYTQNSEGNKLNGREISLYDMLQSVNFKFSHLVRF